MIEQKIKQLIEEVFDKWEGGAKPNTEQERREYVLNWLEVAIETHKTSTLLLTSKFQAVLEEIETNLPDIEKPRFYAKLDKDHLTKTPEGILEKMAREWPEGSHPKINFNNLNELGDLGRFRVVTNFLSDAKEIAEHIESGNSLALSSLREIFQLSQNTMKNCVDIEPGKRKKGERCWKGVFYPRAPQYSQIRIEVQIMTVLSAGWDKKDHLLIYEPRRRGKTVDPQEEIESYELAGTLHLIDKTFDRLKNRILPRGGDA